MKLTFKNNNEKTYTLKIAECKTLTAETVKAISNQAEGYTEMIIPEGITELSDDCLSSLDHIAVVHLPSTLETVTAHSFGFLPIEDVVVHPNNKHLCSLNGVLYSKDLSALIYYPKNKSDERFTTPESVITIKRGAFAGVKNLKHFTATKDVAILEKSCFTNSDVETVDLSACDNMLTIPSWCFTLCRSLKTVLLPHNLKAIKKLAFDVSTITELELPDSVEKLGRNALSRNSLQKIKLPKNLEILGDRVFAGCKELVSLDLSMVKSIHKKSISKCSNLRQFFCDEENDVFSAINGILYDKRSSALLKCPNANEFDNGKLIIPDGVKVIDLAFDSCNHLTEVYIPDSVKTVKRGAFFKCSNLKRIHIGKNCSSIDLFDYCDKVESVEIDKDNPYFISLDGVVFSKDMKRLVYFPRNKNIASYTVPIGVEDICEEAFKGCNNLREIILPCTIKTIGLSAFETCRNLECVNFPDEIKSIGECAFAFCENLLELEIPDNTLVFDYAFIGCMGLNRISKGHNVLYCKHTFAITPHISQDGDLGLLKQILDKAPSKRIPKNRFQDTKKYWGE